MQQYIISRCILATTGTVSKSQQDFSPSLHCITPSLSAQLIPDILSSPGFLPLEPSPISPDLQADVGALFAPKPRDGSVSHADPAVDGELEKLRTRILSQDFSVFAPKQRSPSIQQLDNPVAPLKLRPPAEEDKGKREAIRAKTLVGMYSKEERQRRIARYKDKQRRRRLVHPISRVFEGRRAIAFAKSRVNGRFTKITVDKPGRARR